MLLHTDQTCEFGEADNNLFRVYLRVLLMQFSK